MKKYLVLILMVLLVGTTNFAEAMLVIDQVNPFSNNTGFEAGENDLWQQEVMVGMDGYLMGIDLYWLSNPGINNNKLDFFLNVGSAWQNDVNDFRSTITFNRLNSWNFIDLSLANLYFLKGDQFVFGVQNTYDNTTIGGSYFNQYSAGDLFLGGHSYSNGLWDLGFRTYVDIPNEEPSPIPLPSPVPEPSSMLLLTIGGLATALFRGKRK